MAEDAKTAQRQSVVEQPAAPFATCAECGCSRDAATEVLHHPGDLRLWVPLCRVHRAWVGIHHIAYLVEMHGFIPPVSAEVAHG